MMEVSNFTGVTTNLGYELETEASFLELKHWIFRNWTLGFNLIGIYLLFIFGAQGWMKSQPRLDLRGLLIIWNLFLAGFSIIGAVRMVPEMLELLTQRNGLHNSICLPIDNTTSRFRYWIALFVLSKAPELVDTVFIVLRKQPLIFLHWYHHITVLLYSWYSFAQYIAPSRWFVVMNFVVHAIMYSYYGFRALKFRVPKFVSITITSLQIIQMVLGVYVNLHALVTKFNNNDCDVPMDNIFWALAMYGSYFYLFVQFFSRAYIATPKDRTTVKDLKED